MLEASPKGTVPVLVLPDGKVIDESLTIMRWALSVSDPEGWLQRDDVPLIAANDDRFKVDLDGYKYPERRGGERLGSRERGLRFLHGIEARLAVTHQIGGCVRGFTDAALIPFVRQFAAVDPDWFAAQPLPHLSAWLSNHLRSDLFKSIMLRTPIWAPSNPPTFFPAFE
jgi:glutathione S-transferase